MRSAAAMCWRVGRRAPARVACCLTEAAIGECAALKLPHHYPSEVLRESILGLPGSSGKGRKCGEKAISGAAAGCAYVANEEHDGPRFGRAVLGWRVLESQIK